MEANTKRPGASWGNLIVWGLVVGAAAVFLFIKYNPFRPTGAGDKPLAIVISGDTAGWIVPCGCTSNQSGGLLRRGFFVKELAQDREVLVADAGGAASGTSPYHQVKFEAILQGEKAMGCVAHNIGASEAALGPAYLRKLAWDQKVPFVSANVRDDQGAAVNQLYIVQQRGDGKRIAFTGILSKRYSGPGLNVHEPREALVQLLTQFRDQFDHLIVLAYAPEEELLQLAAAVPEADAIIGGPTGQTVTPKMVGSVLVASATNKGKFLVCLDAAAGEKLTWTGRIEEMGGKYADDPLQKQNVQAYLTRLGEKDIAAAESGFLPALTLRQEEQFRVAGNQSCLPCHQNDCQHWDGTKHAQAWKTLEVNGYHVDSYCQQCHTTGFGQHGGFVSAKRSPTFTSVGCESCHGPAAAHSKDPKIKTPFAAKDQCIRCHDRENSPLFDYDKYWPKIVHGQEKATK